METREDFIGAMTKYYCGDTTPNEAHVAAVMEFLERNNINGGIFLESFFVKVQENIKQYRNQLPDIVRLKEVLLRTDRHVSGERSPLARVVDETKHWSVEKLLRVLNYIWEKDGYDRSAAERNILHEWGKVLYHYWAYRDLGYREEDILKKCEKTKRAIERGERVSDLVPEERRDQQIEEIGDTRQGRAVKFEDIGLPL